MQPAIIQPAVRNDDFLVVPPPVDANSLVLSATTDIASLAQQWRGLELRAVGHVFQTWAWVSNWHTHIGTARKIEPFIVAAHSRDGTMRALLPFGIHSRAGMRTLVWLGDEHADYKGPLIDRDLLPGLTAGAMQRMFDSAVKLAPRIDAVRLLDMPEQFGSTAHPLLVYPNQPAPVASHALTLKPDFDRLYKEHRGTSSRKKLRQKQRRLEEAEGPVSLKIATTPSARSRAISALIDQKRARLNQMGVADMFATPQVRAFYRTLAEQHPDICQLSTLDAGDTPVAANWGLVWGDRYYYVLSTMTSGEHQHLSTGQLHLNELISWSADRGLKVFDFTAGDETYKDDWCDTAMGLFDVHYGLTIKGRLLAWFNAHTRTAKRKIKHHEPLWNTAQKLRKKVHDLRMKTGW
ncbi:GNAT family N-acetyltransferase [Pyruvatibacter sp.]|uniref:GNAT family N-acetyltransferase n=1 Tax=Pyruvatibacter sp. TaxID=1981328 RepID=UPI0032EC5345